MSPQVTLELKDLAWILGIVATGVTAWTVAKMENKRTREQSEANTKSLTEAAEAHKEDVARLAGEDRRLWDRLDDVEREQIRLKTVQEMAQAENKTLLSKIDSQLNEHGKKLDHLMTKGCALGCAMSVRPSQGEKR